MIGIGTIVNGAAVIAGGLLGLLLNKGLPKRFQEIITTSVGLAVIFIGAAGTLLQMLVVEKTGLASQGAMMAVVSLVLGSLLGELLQIEHQMERFGSWLKVRVGEAGDTNFIDGFLVASMTICIGAMAIVGPLQEGLTGDASMLFTKAILDGIILVVLASTTGRGALFSVIPLVVLQGSVTLFARFLQNVVSQPIIDSISLLGSMLIFCIGVNLMFNKHIKVANMLPALLVGAVYTVLF